MSDTALQMADELDRLDSQYDSEIAAELRRLHAENERLTQCLKKANDQAEHFEREWYLRGDLNAELVEALQLALSSYGVMKMGDPPQEAWDVWKVEEQARAALAKVEAGK